jgi:protease secretion system outer membrane protein
MQKPNRRSLWKLTAAAAAVLLQAGAAHALTLEQAYQAALRNDPTFRASYYAGEAGKESRILGRSTLLPNVNGSYSASKNKSDIQTNTSLTHPKYNSRSGNVQLRQALFNLDALARYKQGVAQANASEASVDAARQELIVRVVGAYVEAIFSNEQLALAQAQRNMLAEQKAVNDRLYKGGEGTVTDQLETQAKLDLAEARLLEAKDSQRTALTTLQGIVGEEITSLDSLRPDFKVRPIDMRNFEDWKRSALSSNPTLRAAMFSVEAQRQEVNKAKAGHYPRLDFVATYARNDSETINTLNQETTQRSIGVQLNIPLYAGGAVNATTRQARANEERAKAELQANINKITVELRKEYDAVISGVTRVKALEKAVESTQLLVKATTQSIKGGVRINLDLLNAQEQKFAAERDLAQARFTYMLGTLRLRAAAGVLGEADVKEVASYFR